MPKFRLIGRIEISISRKNEIETDRLYVNSMKGKHGNRRKNNFTDETKRIIWKRDEGVCVYCGSEAQCVDHVIPAKYKGPAITANGVLACNKCNFKKKVDIELGWLNIAFRHLLGKGEDLTWLDGIWRHEKPVQGG